MRRCRVRKSALVAQWIEQEPSNLLVAGSIPAEGTIINDTKEDKNGNPVSLCVVWGKIGRAHV